MLRFAPVMIVLFWIANISLAQKKAAVERPTPPQREVAQRKLPGMQASGLMQFPNQWSLKPAGKQLEVGDFPVNVALHPSEPTAAVLHAGHGEHEVMIVQLDDWKVIARV